MYHVWDAAGLWVTRLIFKVFCSLVPIRVMDDLTRGIFVSILLYSLTSCGQAVLTFRRFLLVGIFALSLVITG